VRESGTHQELLAESGIYFKLFELQYKGGQQSQDSRAEIPADVTGA
jgi:hypothetical protein